MLNPALVWPAGFSKQVASGTQGNIEVDLDERKLYTVTPGMRGSSNGRKYLSPVEKNSAHENSDKFSISNK